jgi:hypothetical protein
LDVITTTIERKWFAEIVPGVKRIEYRDIKPYWTNRLREVRTPFRLVRRNGMSLPIPVVTVRVDRSRQIQRGVPARGGMHCTSGAY